MGFQDMPEVVHKAASRKGGKVRARKGWATLPEEKRKEIAAKGGRTKYENRSKNPRKEEEHRSDEGIAVMDAILRDLDDIHD